MIKQCQRCGETFENGNAAKYCVTCRPIVHNEQSRASAKRRRATNPEQQREYERRYYAKKRDQVRARKKKYYAANKEEILAKVHKSRKIKRQKAKLRAKLQAAAAKRQAELEYHNKLYNPPSMFDGIGVHIPSQLANLGMP